ncbi:MAG: hypothetical protein WCT77_08240, partial [Bacteroidota bacterium]
QDEIQIAITGSGMPLQQVSLRLPVIDLVEPNLSNYHIPVYGTVENAGASINAGSFQTTIVFTNDLFFPVSLTKGSITSIAKINRERRLTIDVPNVSLNNTESVITEIIGYTMLGDTVKTDLQWKDFLWTSTGNFAQPGFENGSMTIKICDRGQPRLITTKPGTVLSIVPNPVEGEFEASVSAYEAGEYRLIISDLNGNSRELKKWNVGMNDPILFKFNFSSVDITGGFYILQLKTPTRVYSEKMMILK